MRLRTVATGLAFPEGPSALPDGRIAVVEMQGEAVTAVDQDGSLERIGDLGGGPNGSTLGADGSVYVANNGGLSAAADGGYWRPPEPFDGRIQRVAPDGTVTTVASDLPGPKPHRPNDLCFGPDGRLYYTDSHNWEDMANLGPGRVCRVHKDGNVEELAELPAFANGIAFSLDDRHLYVVQTLTRKLLAYPWNESGLGEPEQVLRLPKGQMPDGFCLDRDGNFYVCGSLGDAVTVLSPAGETLDVIETGQGSQPTNCCLTPGRLWVTLARTGALAVAEVEAEPHPLHTDAGWAG